MHSKKRTKRLIKNGYSIFFILLACLLPKMAVLAEIEESQSVTNSQEKKPSSNPVNKPKSPSNAMPKTKPKPSFKPNEKISEDFSVPFPVDI